jgi:ACS family hexuronate transporter-like MFS transporter
VRFRILLLLLLATTINYLDRGALGVILPEIRRDLLLDTRTYGWIVVAFQLAYAVGSPLGGKLLDRVGTRVGYGICVGLWSLMAALQGAVRSALGLGLVRAALGLAEAPNFPACNKAAAEWFAPAERATVMGVANFGTNLAQIVGPPVFIALALQLGWRACFGLMGLLGFLWLPAWSLLSPATTRPATSTRRTVALRTIVGYRQAWGYACAKFLTDPVWWLYLVWMPLYLHDVRRLSPGARGLALTLIYAVSGVGALAGGWIAGVLVRRGASLGQARKAIMLACAILVPIGACGVLVASWRLALPLFALATASHQAWMTNLFTTPADVFPARAVGTTNGFGVAAGAIGGALFSGFIPGHVIPRVGYVPVFLTSHLFYVLAWLLIHWLVGDWKPVELPDAVNN